jgi:hypothetical protein
MKLNYIFNNMEHQALDTLIVVHVAMIAPESMIKSSKQQIWLWK